MSELGKKLEILILLKMKAKKKERRLHYIAFIKYIRNTEWINITNIYITNITNKCNKYNFNIGQKERILKIREKVKNDMKVVNHWRRYNKDKENIKY